jgi:glycosyltransferase involved in cell wall biosynthesis
MIVKNEERRLETCLESVRDIVEEIVIIDTGSTDRTKEIASKYTQHIIEFKWINDFASARNFSFAQATMDYILWLDADDVFISEDVEKFIRLKQSLDPSIDAVSMIYNYGFDDNGNVTLSLRRNRLVKRSRQFQWHGAVHEYLSVGGNILNSDIAITHTRIHSNSDRNLRIFEERLKSGEHLRARDLYYYANELMDHHLYDKAIQYYRQFLDSGEGWIEDEISSCDKLSEIYNRLGEKDKELQFILKSFEYDTPRAEFCCRLGFHFMQKNEIRKSIFWYILAIELEKPKDSWGFFYDACWTWLPHIQLCVCYYQLGENELAYKHNEIARQYLPKDEKVLHNKHILESLLSKD